MLRGAVEANIERLEVDVRDKQRQIDQANILLEQQVEQGVQKDKRIMQQGEDIVQLQSALAQHAAVAKNEAHSITSESQVREEDLCAQEEQGGTQCPISQGGALCPGITCVPAETHPLH